MPMDDIRVMYQLYHICGVKYLVSLRMKLHQPSLFPSLQVITIVLMSPSYDELLYKFGLIMRILNFLKQIFLHYFTKMFCSGLDLSALVSLSINTMSRSLTLGMVLNLFLARVCLSEKKTSKKKTFRKVFSS